MLNTWYVYIIKSTDNRLYTGITTDILRRWNEHLGSTSQLNKGAKFFRGRKPLSLEFVEKTENRSVASKKEAAIKRLSRDKKEKLCLSSINQLKQYSEFINLRNDND